MFARAFARPAPAPTTQEGAHAIDTLELQVQRIYTDDEGDMAVVQADVLLPVRGKVTAMSLVALLTRTDAAGDWRWVALQFSPRSPGS